ncbi:hypothetical protein FNU76_02315 [Chitinimonas arctica]|uniref:Uncharacterized protein n=1 Tax=Chitinimonas arctica TaxID=2594795 RepID=A0A516SB29_9NEIS|nr:hypothetical protein [Chitinimonas arctica]QDQ25278.1 hypothetical protein FNU76_02315 [Chitinimonas arctica]
MSTANKIFSTKDSIHEVVNAFMEHGIVAIMGSDSAVQLYSNWLMNSVTPYPHLAPKKGSASIVENADLHYIFDLNRHDPSSIKFQDLLQEIAVYRLGLYGMQLKVFDQLDNVNEAAETLIRDGIVAIAAPRSTAVPYLERVQACIAPYVNVKAILGFQPVPSHGYLYYLRDANRYALEDERLAQRLLDLDAQDRRYCGYTQAH